MSKPDGEALNMHVMGSTSNIFKVFTLPIIQGDPKSLDEPNTAFVTESMAKKFFGSENPINQILSTGMDKEIKKFKIVGIIRDIPQNSHFNTDFLFSLVSCSFYRNAGEDWGNSNFYTYLVLHNNVSYKDFEGELKEYTSIKLAPIVKELRNMAYQEWLKSGEKMEFFLQPLTKIHLRSSLTSELSQNGDINYIYISLIIGLFILIISIVNFTNLTIIKSFSRIREICIRKTFGASWISIMLQFLFDSCIFSLLALLIALFLIGLGTPWFNYLSGINIPVSSLLDWNLLLCLIPFFIIIGLLSGLYPALYFSEISPVKVYVSNSNIKISGLFIKDLLLILQFTVTIIVIIGAIVVTRQLDFLQNQKIGFNKDNIIVVKQTDELTQLQQQILKAKILQNSSMITASYSHMLPDMGWESRNYTLNVENDQIHCVINTCPCDAAFLDTYKFELSAGSFFQEQFSENPRKIILTERAVKEYNIPNPIGKQLFVNSKDYYEIIGIVKNFHYNSKRKEIQPAAFVQEPDRNMFWSPEFLSIRVNGLNNEKTLEYIREQWDLVLPGKEFIFSYFSKDYEIMYKSEAQTKRLLYIFSFIAISLSCFGLFSLVKYVILKRTKEIGIRKVNGAKAINVLNLLSHNYIKWVSVAYIIGCPVSWYVMRQWLNNFAYRTELSWWIFVMAGLIVFGIMLLTVSWQSWRAATRNPIEALRFE
jgi:putative ABC transport system permease protein